MRFSCDCDSELQSQENRKSHLHCCDYISPANAISFSFNIKNRTIAAFVSFTLCDFLAIATIAITRKSHSVNGA